MGRVRSVRGILPMALAARKLGVKGMILPRENELEAAVVSRNVVTMRFADTLCYQDGEGACLAAFEGGPAALAFQRFDEATRQAVRGAYLESIESFRTGSGYRIPAEFVLGCGEKPE